MTNPQPPEPAAMLLVDCPLCDMPAPLDAGTGALDCPTCAMRFELADEIVGQRTLPELAVAA
jgi:hypothetical protein